LCARAVRAAAYQRASERFSAVLAPGRCSKPSEEAAVYSAIVPSDIVSGILGNILAGERRNIDWLPLSIVDGSGADR
jgi:hypothetical protein